MTADQLVAGLAACRTRIKTLGVENSRLKVDNQRVWESREEWKAKYTDRWKEVQELRRSLKRCRASRDRWRNLAYKRGEKLYNYRRNGAAPWHNVSLSERDLERIMGMKPR
jgi:hypothetical protein